MIPTPVLHEEQVKVAPPATTPLAAAPPAAAPPKAVKRGRGLGWVMVAICAAAGGLLATAAYKYLHTLGNVIVIHFQDAQGLRPGADLRYRGVAIGRVTDVRVRSDLGGVDVNIALNSDAPPITCQGSRFWIVHPSVSMATGVTGLDTAIGDKYVSVLPAVTGPVADDFVGEEEPPLPQRETGSICVATSAGPDLAYALRRGAPVTCCGIRIGEIRQVKLGKGGRDVQATVCVHKRHASLVRAKSWFAPKKVLYPGFRFDLQALIGGLELKLPERPGEPAKPGQELKLAESGSGGKSAVADLLQAFMK
jgi:paraquat-inducible protein B